MPVTFPAHQGLVAPIKLRWPNAIDGTALCIAAAAPDLAYALGLWLNRQSHTALGLVVWAVPFSLLAVAVTRWRAAAGIFAAMPDLGPLRLQSYRVLGLRRPHPLVTVSSCLLGAGSHIFIDGFTHRGRWGADLLGLNGVVATVPIVGEMSVARVLQYLGHGFGSLAFVVVVLAIVAGSGRLEQWYGADQVAAARAGAFGPRKQLLFWLLVFAPTGVVAVAAGADDRSVLFSAITGLVFSILIVGVAFGGDQSPTSGSSQSGSASPDSPFISKPMST